MSRSLSEIKGLGPRFVKLLPEGIDLVGVGKLLQIPVLSPADTMGPLGSGRRDFYTPFSLAGTVTEADLKLLAPLDARSTNVRMAFLAAPLDNGGGGRGGATALPPANQGTKHRLLIKGLSSDSTDADIFAAVGQLVQALGALDTRIPPQHPDANKVVAEVIFDIMCMFFGLSHEISEKFLTMLISKMPNPATLERKLNIADGLAHDGNQLMRWQVVKSGDGRVVGIKVNSMSETLIPQAAPPVEPPADNDGEGVKEDAVPEFATDVVERPQRRLRSVPPTTVEGFESLVELLKTVELFATYFDIAYLGIAQVLRSEFGGDPKKNRIVRYALAPILSGGIGTRLGLGNLELLKFVLEAVEPYFEPTWVEEIIQELRKIRLDLVGRLTDQALIDVQSTLESLPLEPVVSHAALFLAKLPDQETNRLREVLDKILPTALVRYLFGDVIDSAVAKAKGEPATGTASAPAVQVAATPPAPAQGSSRAEPVRVVRGRSNGEGGRRLELMEGLSNGVRAIMPFMAELEPVLRIPNVRSRGDRFAALFPNGRREDRRRFFRLRSEIFRLIDSVIDSGSPNHTTIIRGICKDTNLSFGQLKGLIEWLSRIPLTEGERPLEYTIVTVKEGGFQYRFRRRAKVRP